MSTGLMKSLQLRGAGQAMAGETLWYAPLNTWSTQTHAVWQTRCLEVSLAVAPHSYPHRWLAPFESSTPTMADALLVSCMARALIRWENVAPSMMKSSPT